MNRIIFFLILINFSSCSSTSSGKRRGDGQIDDRELDRLKTMKNEDFQFRAEVPYLAQEDNYEKYRLDGAKEDVLATESLSRAGKDDWEKVKDPADPVSKMAALCYLGKFEEAYTLIDEKFNEFRKHPPYWNQVGSCYLLQGQFLTARLYYNKAVEIDKDYAPAINNLGLLYIREKKDQKAFSAFKLALEKNSFSMTPAFNLAQLYLKYGFLNEAREKFKILHSQNAADKDVLTGLGIIELLKGNAEGALNFFSRVDPSGGDRPELNINYSLALKLAGKDSEAMEMLNKMNPPQEGPWKEYHSRVSHFIEGK